MVHFELKIMPGDTRSTVNDLFVSQISKRSVAVTDNLVKSWMSYHYRSNLGVSGHQDTRITTYEVI